VFEFLLSIPKTFLCSVSVLQVKNVLLDVFRVKFVGTLTNMELKLFFLIVIYNGNLLIINELVSSA
jgi:hypothetical protein